MLGERLQWVLTHQKDEVVQMTSSMPGFQAGEKDTSRCAGMSTSWERT